jgi:hypothetical protein
MDSCVGLRFPHSRNLMFFIVLALGTIAIFGCSKRQPKVFRDDKVYIDSVPRGALVSLLPIENEDGKEIVLGKTPLVLDPSQTPSMRFLIMMEMDGYLKAIGVIPELKEWAERFKIEQRFVKASGLGGMQDYFLFEDTAYSQVVTDVRGGLRAVGPIYTLDWPTHHRLVALFIPRGVKVTTFYPLMPACGTFELHERDYGNSLVRDYGFSAEQRDEAVGSLSRCGKYVTKVRSTDGSDTARLYCITAQKGYYVSTISIIRVIQDFNE